MEHGFDSRRRYQQKGCFNQETSFFILSPCPQHQLKQERLTRNPSWILHCPTPALPHLHCLANRALISPRGGNHCFNTYTPINLGENIRRRRTFDALQRLVVRWFACSWSKDTEVLWGVKRQRNNLGWIIPLGDGESVNVYNGLPQTEYTFSKSSADFWFCGDIEIGAIEECEVLNSIDT